MDNILEVLAKVLDKAGDFASTSTSAIIFYQPEKPECMKNVQTDKNDV